MKILMLDNDMDYPQRFKYYFSKKYPDTELAVCDNVESLKEMLEEEKYDVVLFGADFDGVNLEELEEIMGNSAFAYISPTNEIINEKETIYKYRKITELYSKICTIYEKKKNRIVRQNNMETRPVDGTAVITFLPVHGGAGCSTMAAACAISLAAEASVLYINLEQCPSDSVFFKNGSQKGITDIISALKTKYTEAGIYKLLKEIIQQDQIHPEAGVFNINGYQNILDCMSMSAQCIDIMFKTLRTKFNYDYIIIDTDNIVGPVLQKLIVSSDKLVFVSSGSDISNVKLAEIHRYLEVLERENESEMPENFILFNQYYGMKDEETFVRDMKIVYRFLRYRTNDKSRITSQKIIDEVLKHNDAFAILKNHPAPAPSTAS